MSPSEKYIYWYTIEPLDCLFEKVRFCHGSSNTQIRHEVIYTELMMYIDLYEKLSIAIRMAFTALLPGL